MIYHCFSICTSLIKYNVGLLFKCLFAMYCLISDMDYGICPIFKSLEFLFLNGSSWFRCSSLPDMSGLIVDPNVCLYLQFLFIVYGTCIFNFWNKIFLLNSFAHVQKVQWALLSFLPSLSTICLSPCLCLILPTSHSHMLTSILCSVTHWV